MIVQTIRIKVLKKKKGTAGRCGKVKSVLSVKRDKLCDSAVTDKAFNFHAVNDSTRQSDAVVRLKRILHMTPYYVATYSLDFGL